MREKASSQPTHYGRKPLLASTDLVPPAQTKLFLICLALSISTRALIIRTTNSAFFVKTNS
jgi:hypothetical protein